MEVSGNHPVVMDDHVSIETHGDLGITHFQNPPYIHIHVCIALHYITLHYIALHYTALHYITLHYITLHYIMYIYNYIIISYIIYTIYTSYSYPTPQRRSDPAPCRSRSPPSPQRLPWPSPQSWPSTPSSRLPERNIVQQDPGDMT